MMGVAMRWPRLRNWRLLVLLVAGLTSGLGCSRHAIAAPQQESIASTRSLANRILDWPSWEQFVHVISLQDYNIRVVVLGTTLLGCAAGMVGSFTLLRKRALMGDALAHSTLPGIVLAYMIVTVWGGDGKTMPVLLLGATVSGLMGVGVILGVSRWTRLKEDTALGAVLSVFFGAGVSLLSLSTQMKEGSAAGLESFIYGKTASMGMADTQLIAAAAAICIAISVLLFKEFKLLCFDDGFAGSRGFPVSRLDMALMGLVIIVTIVGLQAVGLILMIALLIIPAAAARFWTEDLSRMFGIAGAIGGASGLVGAIVSALFSKLPSGAMIVLVCTAIFLLSMAFGASRGIYVRSMARRRLNRSVDRQHLLRAMYELLEPRTMPSPLQNKSLALPKRKSSQSVSVEALLNKRSWSRFRLTREIARSQRDELVDSVEGRYRLTKRGLIEAERLTRQHRLWELYLIHYAEVAPARVDRDADAIEHVLEPDIVAELEALLDSERVTVPASPHALASEQSLARTRE